MTGSPPPPPIRRHDLDALRAVAMLLGIALHGALSFWDLPWLVQDTRQLDAFGHFFHAVHGFRMPLFFMMSGFFTAMLWRRRGVRALVKHRFARVFCPLCLGMVTIIPILNWIGGMAIEAAIERSLQSPAEPTAEVTVWSAAHDGDVNELRAYVAGGANINAWDERLGATPLSWAVLAGQIDAVDLLLELGADVNARNRDGGTALHCAALFAQTDPMRVLLEHGAEVDARTYEGHSPLDSTRADLGTVRFIATLFEVTLDEQTVKQGREASADLLRQHGAGFRPPAPHEQTQKKRQQKALWDFLVGWPVFHHLWFLWHLCWLVAGFSLVVLLARILPLPRLPDWVLLSPANFCWLIPLTLVAQATMDGFGPDTSTGLLPMPHVVGYYAIFFGFGALYYTCGDPNGRISRGWWLILPLGLLLVLPLCLEAIYRNTLLGRDAPHVAVLFLQAVYPWLIIFGLMGLFRKLLRRENRTIRYISDSSYWLYLAHLPLIIAAQMLVRDWPAPAGAKFLLICVGVSALLLVSYQALVRYTWVGALLNGRRTRPPPAEGTDR